MPHSGGEFWGLFSDSEDEDEPHTSMYQQSTVQYSSDEGGSYTTDSESEDEDLVLPQGPPSNLHYTTNGTPRDVLKNTVPTCPTCGTHLHDEEPLSQPTAQPKATQDQLMVELIHQIHELMAPRRVSLMKLLTALFWGTPACASDPKIQKLRSQFLRNKEGLLALLQTWHSPPRTYTNSHRSAPEGAHDVLTQFSLDTITSIVSKELATVDPVFRSTRGCKAYTKEELTQFNPESVLSTLQNEAPTSWSLFRTIATTKRQGKNTHKEPDRVGYLIIPIPYYTQLLVPDTYCYLLNAPILPFAPC